MLGVDGTPSTVLMHIHDMAHCLQLTCIRYFKPVAPQFPLELDDDYD